MKTIVIAHYNEDITWVDALLEDAEVFIISKGEGGDLPNEGREPHSYFHFIVENYDTLEGTYFFTQGRPFDHEPRFIEIVKEGVTEPFRWLGTEVYRCKADGTPHHPRLPIHDVVRVWTSEEGLREEYEFHRGCIVAVQAERIYRWPKELYEQLLALMLVGEHPWCMERLWAELWQ